MSSGITGTFAKSRQVGTPLFLCPGYVTYLFLTRSPLNVLPLPSTHLVRLACLSHAASVRSEPGSNSSLCIVGTAPANRDGVAYEKKGSYTHLLRSEDMLRRRAGQVRLDFTPIVWIGSRQPLCPKRLSQLRLQHHILTIDCTVYLSKSSSAMTNSHRLSTESRSAPNEQSHIIPSKSHLSRGSLN